MSTRTVDVALVQGRQDFQTLEKAIHESQSIGFDLETTGLDPRLDSILLYQFATERGTFIVNARTLYEEERDRPFDPVCNSLLGWALRAMAEKEVIGHNLRFEYQFILKKHGVRLGKMFDTQLAEAVLTAGRNDQRTDLGSTLKRRLRLDVDKELQTSFIGADRFTFEPTFEQLSYAANDVLHLHRLRNAQRDKLAQEELEPTYNLEVRCIPVFADMELAGLTLDLDAHEKVLAVYRAEVEQETAHLDTTLALAWNQWDRVRYAAEKATWDGRQAIVQRRTYFKNKNPEGDIVPGTAQAKAIQDWRDEVKPKPLAAWKPSSRRMVLRALAEYGLELPDLKKQTVKLWLAKPEMDEEGDDDETVERAEEYRGKQDTVSGQQKWLLNRYAAWSTANKVVTTYGETLRAKVHPLTGRVHPHYNQIVSTGRTSSSDPNGQNMPKKIRGCFVPQAGSKFVVADFANMELRIAAGLSGDRMMIDAFNNGWDFHCMTAAAAWPEKYASWRDVDREGDDRKATKTMNFLTIYGGSAYAAYWRGLLESLELAERVQEGFKNLCPVAWEFVQESGEQGLKNLYAKTALGRKRYFRPVGPRPQGGTYVEDPDSKEMVPAVVMWERRRRAIKRQAMNHPVQGTGADIAKLAMYFIWRGLQAPELEGRARICGMVHDEIVVECAEECVAQVEQLVSSSMVRAGAKLIKGVAIPADVHVVERWEK